MKAERNDDIDEELTPVETITNIDETAIPELTNDCDELSLRRHLENGFEFFFTEGRLNSIGLAFYEFLRSPKKYFGADNELNASGIQLFEIFSPALHQMNLGN